MDQLVQGDPEQRLDAGIGQRAVGEVAHALAQLPEKAQRTVRQFVDPRALADALGKIDRYAQGLPLQAAEAHPATAHLMIVNPLTGAGLTGLFRTHPPTAERIHRLLAMTA